MLTAYDYPTAKIIDNCNIPIILVGDSLGNVVLGQAQALLQVGADVLAILLILLLAANALLDLGSQDQTEERFARWEEDEDQLRGEVVQADRADSLEGGVVVGRGAMALGREDHRDRHAGALAGALEVDQFVRGEFFIPPCCRAPSRGLAR